MSVQVCVLACRNALKNKPANDKIVNEFNTLLGQMVSITSGHSLLFRIQIRPTDDGSKMPNMKGSSRDFEI